MILKRLISGGQTGADRAGLEVAEKLGIPTGGMAPKGYRTEAGTDYTLRDKFHLTESESMLYPPRTERNVHDSDGTVIFGNVYSQGSELTIAMCKRYNRPYICNPTAAGLKSWLEANNIEELNVAGNRKSQNMGVERLIHEVLGEALKDWKPEEKAPTELVKSETD